jgi:hypothetical protein
MALAIRSTAVEVNELYCYIKNSVVSQASCRIHVARLEHELSKFTHGEANSIRRLPHRWQRTMDALED